MKSEDLFAAIGGVESSRLERSELTVNQSSRNTHEEETKVKHKNTKKLIRNLLIAAVVAIILSVTAYAVVNARIRLETTKYQNDKIVTEEPTGTYNLEIDFQKTTNEYLELGSVYPQSIPDGYTLSFVSDKLVGSQRLVYNDKYGEFAFEFNMKLGSDGGQLYLDSVKSAEPVTVNDCPGMLYTSENGSRLIVWQNEVQGVGFAMHFADKNVDALAIANSVAPGKPLTPTLASGYDTALAELGDYRITALPDGFVQTDFMASPLESGGDWYAYVRRWYGDKVTTDNTIYFEYEHFQLESDEPTNHPMEPVENTPETILRYMGGGESTTIQGMPGAISDESVIWVDWDAQVVFKICASNRTSQEMLALANSVQRFN